MIKESDPSDQAKYECVASNSVGTEYAKSIMLYVKSKYYFASIVWSRWFLFYFFNFKICAVKFRLTNISHQIYPPDS